MTGGRAGGSARERLLDAVVVEVRSTGVGRQSLRQLAAAAGTSHRMLIYHFGSREGLIAAVSARLVDRQIQVVTRRHPEADGATPIRQAFEKFWERSLAEIEASGPMMLELWVETMGAEPDSAGRRQLDDSSSIPPLREFWLARGYTPAFAADLAVLHRAAGRGLMLDLLLGGDPDDVRRCLVLFGAAFSLAADDHEKFEQRQRSLTPPPRRSSGMDTDMGAPAVPSVSDPEAVDPEASGGVSGPGPGSNHAPGSAPSRRGERGTRRALLDAIMLQIGGGIRNRSLRQLADEVGTSHRMLIYHFGSRDGLMAEIAARLENEQAADLRVLVGADVTGNPNTARFLEFWDRVLDRVDVNGPLVFELAARSLHGEPSPEQVRAMMIDCYRPALAGWWHRLGFSRLFAEDVARLHVTIARGLMVDYLLGGAEPDGRRAFGLFGAMFHLAATGNAPGELEIEAVLPPRRRSRSVNRSAELVGGTTSSQHRRQRQNAGRRGVPNGT